jgi:hypothetical protein
MSRFLKRINPIARLLAYTRKTDFFNVDYHKKYGEGTKFDLDYGKLLIIALCIYIAIKV